MIAPMPQWSKPEEYGEKKSTLTRSWQSANHVYFLGCNLQDSLYKISGIVFLYNFAGSHHREDADMVCIPKDEICFWCRGKEAIWGCTVPGTPCHQTLPGVEGVPRWEGAIFSRETIWKKWVSTCSSLQEMQLHPLCTHVFILHQSITIQ